MNMMRYFLIFSILTTQLFSSYSWAKPVFGPVDMGAFYQSLPAINPNDPLGKLIKVEKIETSIQNAYAWKIAYISSDVLGNKTLVTGIIVAPIGKASASDRPVVAWAHGTTGTAQTCGPSQILNPAQPLNQYFLMNGNSWTDFGIPAIDSFIKAGYVVVATDYQGLGGGGKHQYTVSVSQAYDVINSVRAVTQLKETGAGSKAIIYGWSQGGGATITAAGLSDYLQANDTVNNTIKLIGFVAMAPYDVAIVFPNKIKSGDEATQYLQKLSDSFGANIFNFTHYAQNLWGMAAAFPELSLDDILTPDGVKVVDAVMARKCMHVASDTLNFAYGNSYKKLLKKNINHALTWIEDYKKGSVPSVKPMAPVIIYWGTEDTTVPPVMGKLYYEQMCKLNANITRVQLPGKQSHFTTPGSAEPFYVQWIADRFAGKSATNGCSTGTI
ncbi:MAG: alpha/beta fold hydrolase [Gammaproteobacteria bacterium]